MSKQVEAIIRRSSWEVACRKEKKKMEHVRNSFLILAIACISCFSLITGPASAAPQHDKQPTLWAQAHQFKLSAGTYHRNDNGQFNSSTLTIVPYQESKLKAFAFKVTKGSESENESHTYSYSGLFKITSSSTAEFTNYEDDASGQSKIIFSLIGDKSIEVSHTGSAPFYGDGTYTLSYQDFDLTAELIQPILEELTPASTSLTKINRPYKLIVTDQQIGGHFYKVKAFNTVSGQNFAIFWVSPSLNAILRTDTDDAPVLIYGKLSELDRKILKQL